MMKTQIPKKFKPIIEKISQTAFENGFETYIVGGFVRDLFLDRQPYDLDIMVEDKTIRHCGQDLQSPTTDEIIGLARNDDSEKDAGIRFAQILAKKYKTIQPVLFKRFGTAKLIIDDEDVEFVMPRKEYYSDDSRNPDTELGTIEQDALRRDFTVNALFLRLSDMQVLDLTKKGFDDIKNKIIRVSDPAAAEFIFAQDPLRILRGVRQSLQLGFTIEPSTFDAMRKTAARIDIVSPERIRDEIDKMLLCANPSKAFEILDKISLLQIIFPDIKKLQGLKQPPKYHFYDVYEHTMKVLDRTAPFLPLRMSALMHDAGKLQTNKEIDGRISFYGHEEYSAQIAKKVLKDLKYSKEFIAQVSNIVKNHMRVHSYDAVWTDSAIRRLVIACADNLDLTISLAKADYGKTESNPRIKDLQERINHLKTENKLYPKPDLIGGQELMERFKIKQGKIIGKIKTAILDASIENPNLTKKEALEIAEKMIRTA
ncbi:MAG: CCA tRNA nucleotidyltransferase [Elusimicrobiota bacterium]|jgi:tRNA nucleotidyltransferase/poly(A) polymerase|nr:CCA tRNA nucleotidyltransferase [Elusimicrobiota bacterium]